MTYREALTAGSRLLEKYQIPDAKTDAWLLFAAACGIDRNFYYMHMEEAVADQAQEVYENFLKQRIGRMPLQYITGEQEFMGLPFRVNPHVLIPRQDTEILVEEALKRIRPDMQVLDMCTGSGCIIVSICKSCRDIRAVACDISVEALAVAAENAKTNGVQVQLVQGDLFEQIQGEFDVIVSNPPYIPTGELSGLMQEVRDFEPQLALDGDADGLLFYRRMIKDGKRYLKPGGFLLFEIGCDQGQAVSDLMRQAGYQDIEVSRDLAGLDRVVTGVLPQQ